MNYLTNYYKNLSEQLQEKLNHLQKLLNESSASYYGGSGDQRTKPKHGSPYDNMRRKFGTPEYDGIASMKAYQDSVRAIETHPERQRLMIDALAGTWSEQHGGSGKQRRAFRSDVASRLQEVGGSKGFESFDHAKKAMIPIMLSTPSFREEIIGNVRETMHPEEFENFDIERHLRKVAEEHVDEVGSDAIRHAETRIGFLN